MTPPRSTHSSSSSSTTTTTTTTYPRDSVNTTGGVFLTTMEEVDKEEPNRSSDNRINETPETRQVHRDREEETLAVTSNDAPTISRAMSVSSCNSRQHDHDDPPALPATAALSPSTTTGSCSGSHHASKSGSGTSSSADDHSSSFLAEEEKTGAAADTADMVESSATSASSPQHSHSQSRHSQSRSGTSSVRLSLTTDSNYSSCSSNKSTGRKGRSLALRKIPVDTALFAAANKKTTTASSTCIPNSSLSFRTNTTAPSSDGFTLSARVSDIGPNTAICLPPVLDNSDSTRLEDDGCEDTIDENTDIGKASSCSSSSKSKAHKTASGRFFQFLTRKQEQKAKNQQSANGDNNNDSNSSATESCARRFLRVTCLRPTLSLQSQMLLSFGMVSTLTILVVICICIAVSVLSGNKVNDLTQTSLEDLASQMEGKIGRYVAETLSNRLLPYELVQVLHDTVIDRMIGYPDYPGYENDTLTPFQNVLVNDDDSQQQQQQQRRTYPVKGPPSQLDWDLQNVVTPENAHEHVLLHRYSLYQKYEQVSTSYAAYSFQGSCNPQATDGNYDWYKNCTDANNNITTGGVVQPVPTNQFLYERSSDLTPFLKALYEDTPTLRDIGICFANDGAGSTVVFPGYSVDGTGSYVSEGCDWMKTPNPLDPSKPIGTPEMIKRCHPKGQVVQNREYNALERPWCIDQALHQRSIRLIGPFQDVWNPEHQLMLAGKAVYDPLTKEFIGCLFMDFTIANVHRALVASRVTNNSQITITRWDRNGTVAASSAWNLSTTHETPTLEELPVGISPEVYQKLYDMVDYSVPWNPKEVRDLYAKTIHQDSKEGFFVGAYPMPSVPPSYDPNYRPAWLVIMSVAMEDVLEAVDGLQSEVDNKVDRLVYGSLLVGFVGWGAIMSLIIVVSRALTLPLKRINQAAEAIVQNFGGTSEKDINFNARSNTWLAMCTPKTELSLVVVEFEKMVHKFSGKSQMAKAVQQRFTELANHFSFQHEFEDLYKSRKEGSFRYFYDEEKKESTAIPGVVETAKNRSSLQRKHKGLHLVHFGSILTGSQSHLSPQQQQHQKSSTRYEHSVVKAKRLTSPLFLWIVVCIVTPLLIMTVAMTVVVTYNLSNELTDVIDDGKDDYIRLEKFALTAAVALRADWIAGKTERYTRNLHIITRYASWLLFGGLERRETFTKLTTGADQCKIEAKPLDCPYLQEFPCACSWDAKYGTCYDAFQEQEDYSFRYMQETSFVCESHDTLPDGDRNSSLSFPTVSYSPETTAWWTDAKSVPGNDKGSYAAGYDTTYDRLRVLSSIPVFQTLYNYETSTRTVLQSAVAMEADGMIVGYQGCSLTFTGEAVAAFWESSASNHANDIRPSLCPIGKFGYDPRCREWYDTGRKLAKMNDTELFVATPYQFAIGTNFGQTCTSPLLDPRTGEHVGQAFIDYKSDPTFSILAPEETILSPGGFPILIAARPDRNGADAIIGPGFKLGKDTPKPIEEVILGKESDCLEPSCARHQEELQTLLSKMRSGQRGVGVFSTRTDDGSEEQMFVAYSPVIVNTYHSLNSSDFTRGVRSVHNKIYYLALTETETSLVAAFDQVEEDLNLTIDIGVSILSIAIVLATILVVYISYWVAISMTQPMLYLLELIRHINELDEDGINFDLDRQSGSLEVKNVAHTMGTLYRIVQCANSAYFAGDIDKAYAVFADSARLFKRLDNNKAVGVANNNMGNTMLAMYRTMRDSGVERYCGLSRKEIVLKGMSYFHQAIQLGEKAYDEFHEAEGWSPSCLDFMQHLANRYFNRAMFLLTVKDDHDNPKELEDLGMRDLQIARDMDVEIVDQGTEVGWKVNTADKLFNVALNRARGHLLLLEMGYPDEWDLEELLEESFASVQKEAKNRLHTSELFREISVAGRMQQIDTELMRYKRLKGDLNTASQIAIRMLMEDEFILPEAQIMAVEVLLCGLENDESRSHLRGQLKQYESWLRRAKAKCDTNQTIDEITTEGDVSEVVMMSVAKLNVMASEASDTDDTSKSKSSSLLAATRGDVTMEVF